MLALCRSTFTTNVNKIHHGVPGLIITLLLSVDVLAELSSLPNPSNMILQGPVNQTVHIGQTAIFHCRIHDRHMYGNTKEHLKKQETKQLMVQWIINGFGVTNETLAAVHDKRYQMPGPANQGVHDLVITNIRLEDEATFICQADVKLYGTSKTPIVETFISQPVYLTVIIPPIGLTMKKRMRQYAGFYSQGTTQFEQSVKSILINQHFVANPDSEVLDDFEREDQTVSHIAAADDPAIESSKNEAGMSQFLPRTKQIQSGNVRNRTNAIMSITSQPTTVFPVLWIKEDEALVIECSSEPSKPAANIQWFLSGKLLNAKSTGNSKQQSWRAEAEKFSSKTRVSAQTMVEEFKIFEELQLKPLNKTRVNTSDSWQSDEDSITHVTISVLHLLVRRQHQQQRLECRIGNADVFMKATLPTVAAMIEPVYIDNIHVDILPETHPVEMREGATIQFVCSAITNPARPAFRWALLDAEQYSRDPAFNDTKATPQYYNDSTMHDRLLKSVPGEPTAFKLVLHRRMHLSRVRCWVGVSVPEETEPMSSVSPAQQLWRRAEKTLDILYGATFEPITDSLRAGRIGQTVYLDCQADANPVAQLSLYRIGTEGQQILYELAMLELDQISNRTVHPHRHLERIKPLSSEFPQYTSVQELSPSAVANAIKSKGSQILVSTTQKIRYPLQVNQIGDFGFYACVARNPGFPPAVKHLYVGHSDAPKVVQLHQTKDPVSNVVELVCYIQSVPRPLAGQIRWTKSGQPIETNDRVNVYREQMTFGAKSVLQLRNLQPTDVSNYNCTAANEHGVGWRAIVLTLEAGIPLVFLVGTGAATLLALVFAILLGCFVRHTRHRTSRMKTGLIASPTHHKTNGLRTDHMQDNRNFQCTMELQPMLAGHCQINSQPNYDMQSQNCRLCRTATPVASDSAQVYTGETVTPGVSSDHGQLMAMRVDIGETGGLGNHNCKRSDDSGVETGDLTSVGLSGQNGFSNAPWGAMVLPSPSPTIPHAYYSFLTPRRDNCVNYGETFANAYLTSTPPGSTLHPPTGFFDSNVNPCMSQSIMNRSISPILVVSPHHNVVVSTRTANIYENPVNSSGLILPSVVLQPQTIIGLPAKTGCGVSTSSFSPSQAPQIFPDLSVLPLKFCEHGSLAVSTTSIPVATDHLIHVNAFHRPFDCSEGEEEESGTKV
ncbi:hypothetical protein EG68_00271 [Paragonimus skrjabini miyazakii]|uniref:Ig-like domain-containing protein n=1 Tax=Paragonimus skrjabini miyazakii TaxID=59628 RepID=A0A8S9Z9S3_9TREM|nr:hypothetical protein EG68_00271 [Paragonimus skrjabini miyazakii]